MISNLTLMLILPLINSITPEANSLAVSQARLIDLRLEKIHDQHQLAVSEAVSDSQFLRRLSLDLVGRIPTLSEWNAFENNPNRTAKIDELVESPEFSRFFAEAWTTWLIGYSNAFQTDRETFRIWLEQEIEKDSSFQTIVSDIVKAEGSCAIYGPVNFLARHFEQPEAAICRSFLGVRIECAQCHDHPFDRWTQNDYESFRRFFEPMGRSEVGEVVSIFDRAVEINQDQRPKFLTGAVASTNRVRDELALFVTSCKPFARNFGNRIWYFLMGQGVVHPPDDLNQENPPCDQALLDLLANLARQNDFSIKAMVKAICNSKAYQRSASSFERSVTIEFFAERKIKPLLNNQFIDSLLVSVQRDRDPTLRRQMVNEWVQRDVLNEDHQRTWEYDESIQQLLKKVNTPFRSREVKRPKDDKEIDEIFLRTLTRSASEEELNLCRDRSKSEILFALILGNEFCFNH